MPFVCVICAYREHTMLRVMVTPFSLFSFFLQIMLDY